MNEVADRPRLREPAARSSFAPWNDPAETPLIEFREVTKRFGGFTAVDRLSLSIYSREFFALLGASGSGKTTLMRMLAGFEEPTEGDVRLAGESLAGVPPHRRPVNMMFQSYALFPHLSVRDNIAFGLRRDRLPRREIAERVDEMLRLVQLVPQADRKPHQLSGGQRQRVALARSLAKRPKVLLLDEPLAALDRKLREETQFELMNLQYDLGITFFVVTHDQEEAMVLADRIAIMRDGRIEQVDQPARLYETPRSRYVANFVGNVNLIEGTVRAVDGHLVHLEAEGLSMIVPSETAPAPGTRACVAVRPEKVTMRRHDGSPVGTPNALAGEVEDLAYMGDYTLFRVKTAHGILEMSRFNVRRIEEDPIRWPDRVVLSWDTEDAVFLDR